MSERRLDVAESRRTFGDGTMKDTPASSAVPDPYTWEGPAGDAWSASARRELARRKRLARWQVPRV